MNPIQMQLEMLLGDGTLTETNIKVTDFHTLIYMLKDYVCLSTFALSSAIREV